MVDEKMAFANYYRSADLIFLQGLVLALACFVYVSGIFFQQRRIVTQTRRENEKANFIYSIDHALFNVHERPEAMELALKYVAEHTEAEAAVLYFFKDRTVRWVYKYEPGGADFTKHVRNHDISRDFPLLYSKLLENTAVLAYEEQIRKYFLEGEQKKLKESGINSIMAVPVLDERGDIQCVLCVLNMRKHHKDCDSIEDVMGSFQMAVRAIESYNLVRDMGIIDRLTGLKSRNSYEQDLNSPPAEVKENLHCIFIDANGLHELNNNYGHKMGDRMLIEIAEAIKTAFGGNTAYRIGGERIIMRIFPAKNFTPEDPQTLWMLEQAENF